MSNRPDIKSAIAQTMMDLTHPSIRTSLVEKTGFLKEYNLKGNATITFCDVGLSLQSSILFDAARKVLSDSPEEKIIDTSGKEWKLKNQSKPDELPVLIISSGEQQFLLPDFTVLSPVRAIRLTAFDKISSDIDFPADSHNVWRNTLLDRPLKGNELDQLRQDFCDTPTYIEKLIRDGIGIGQLKVPSFIPPSRRYFERLVGIYDKSESIQKYAAGEGKKLFDRLSSWRPYEGFLLSLFLSSHSSLTDQINVGHLEDKDLIRAFDFLARKGDRLSQLGSIEIGLRILSDRAEITPFVISLIKQIRDDDVAVKGGGFNLFSSLFIFVDGELSSARLMADKPPFYRRLASLAHAALICRQFLDAGTMPDLTNKLGEAAFSYRCARYFFQSLVDMRLEPHWHPDFAAAEQMKKHFLGRILVAAENHKENIKDDELHNLIFGSDSKSLHTLHEIPGCFIPGPLDGKKSTSKILPSNLAEVINQQMNASEVSPASFIGLINSAIFFNIGHETAGSAAKLLKAKNYGLRNIRDKSQFFDIAHGLASVSANAKNCDLADSVRILVRIYRHSNRRSFSFADLATIYLLAAASRDDLNDWRDFIGDCLTELALEDLEEEEGRIFHSNLKILCDISPELWVSCSKADAALSAFNNKS